MLASWTSSVFHESLEQSPWKSASIKRWWYLWMMDFTYYKRWWFINQGSLDCHFGGDQAIQIYGQFEDFRFFLRMFLGWYKNMTLVNQPTYQMVAIWTSTKVSTKSHVWWLWQALKGRHGEKKTEQPTKVKKEVVSIPATSHRLGPKWWFSKGNPLYFRESRLVKYNNLARFPVKWETFDWSKFLRHQW